MPRERENFFYFLSFYIFPICDIPFREIFFNFIFMYRRKKVYEVRFNLI